MITRTIKRGMDYIPYVGRPDKVTIVVNGNDERNLALIGRAEGEEMRKRSLDTIGYCIQGFPAFYWRGDDSVEVWPMASKDFIINLTRSKEMKFVANPVVVDAHVITEIGEYDERGNLSVKVGGEDHIVRSSMMSRYKPVVGDYIVVQDDGYTYLNPKAVFERKYSPMPNAVASSPLSDAIGELEEAISSAEKHVFETPKEAV